MQNKVEIFYNPYTQTSRVIINGNSVSPQSRIANIMSEPMTSWEDTLMPLLSDALNDTFSLHFVSNPIECAVAEFLGKLYPACESITTGEHSIMQSAVQRAVTIADSFARECPSLFGERRSLDVYYSPTMPPNEVENRINDATTVLMSMPESFELDVVARGSVDEYKDNASGTIALIFAGAPQEVEEYAERFSSYSGRTYIVCNFGVKPIQLVRKVGNSYGFFSDFDALGGFLLWFLDYSLISSMISDSIKQASSSYYTSCGSDYPQQHSAIRAAGAVDPVVKDIIIPDIIETERSATATVSYFDYPAGVTPPEVEYWLSREGYLKCIGNTFYGLNDGEVDIEAHEKGSIRHFFRKKVRVRHYIRVTSLELGYGYECIGQGDTTSIPFTYLPEDAETIDRIRWSSSNTSVATVSSNGTIKGVGRGTAVITADVEGVRSICNIEVKPYVSQIDVSTNNIQLYFNHTAPLNIRLTPENSFDANDLIIAYTQERIAEYDSEHGVVAPRGRGNTQIKMYMRSHPNVSNYCNVTVDDEYHERGGHLFMILAASAFMLNLFCQSVPVLSVLLGIGSFILSIISLNKDNDSWKGVNVILMIINILITLF